MASAVAGRAAFPGQFAVTMDAWTSRGMHGYLGVTIAYIDEAWTLQSSVIACAPLRTPHSGNLVAEALKRHLPHPAKLNHVCAIVTDNGANFVRATELLTSDRGVRCAAHTIQLVLKSVAKQEPMQGILECITKLLARFAHSQSRREARAGIKPLMPIVPAPTRWDSNYYVLRRFCLIYPALVRMSPEKLGFSGAAAYGETWAAVAASAPLGGTPVQRAGGLCARHALPAVRDAGHHLARAGVCEQAAIRDVCRRRHPGSDQDHHGAAARRGARTPAALGQCYSCTCGAIPRSGPVPQRLCARRSAKSKRLSRLSI
jgi:hypothetical protein